MFTSAYVCGHACETKRVRASPIMIILRYTYRYAEMHHQAGLRCTTIDFACEQCRLYKTQCRMRHRCILTINISREFFKYILFIKHLFASATLRGKFIIMLLVLLSLSKLSRVNFSSGLFISSFITHPIMIKWEIDHLGSQIRERRRNVKEKERDRVRKIDIIGKKEGKSETALTKTLCAAAALPASFIVSKQGRFLLFPLSFGFRPFPFSFRLL